MRYWPFVRGIHRSPVDSPHKGQWRTVLIFSLIFAWTNGRANNRDTDYLRRHRAHYDVTVMGTTRLIFCALSCVIMSPSYFPVWEMNTEARAKYLVYLISSRSPTVPCGTPGRQIDAAIVPTLCSDRDNRGHMFRRVRVPLSEHYQIQTVYSHLFTQFWSWYIFIAPSTMSACSIHMQCYFGLLWSPEATTTKQKQTKEPKYTHPTKPLAKIQTNNVCYVYWILPSCEYYIPTSVSFSWEYLQWNYSRVNITRLHRMVS